MNRRLLAIGVVALLALSGCAGFGGEAEPTDDDQSSTDSDVVQTGVRATNNSASATNVTYAVGITVTDAVAGEQLSAIGATFPEAFTVDTARPDELLIGIDTDGDGTINRGFQETAVSGVTNTDDSFEVTMDSEYTLQSGDVVLVQYPGVDNPSEPGEYTVETGLNGERMADWTVVIE